MFLDAVAGDKYVELVRERAGFSRHESAFQGFCQVCRYVKRQTALQTEAGILASAPGETNDACREISSIMDRESNQRFATWGYSFDDSIRRINRHCRFTLSHEVVRPPENDQDKASQNESSLHRS